MASFKVSMENLVTFLLTALCFFCQTSNCQDYSSCGLRSVHRGKIFGGLESRPGMWPWQVAIFRWSSDEGQRPRFVCGGALINSRWVLSAAHCFHKRPSEKYIHYRYTIKAGDHNIVSKDPHEQERNAFRIYNHPNFIPSTYENDIALVELDKGVKMGPKVRSICLPNANENISAPGEIVSIAGWGFKTKNSLSSVLLYSAFEIQSNKNCKDKTGYLFNETVMFCAGHGQGGNDTCKGDSGGSTVREVLRDGRLRWVTVGLVSWGEECGIKGKYGYYTRVEPFVNWIQTKISGSILSCRHPGNIPNGRISGSDFLVGFTVKYKCNEGYRLRGRSRSRCKRNGKWNRAPTCRKVECRDPGSPRNGVRRPRRKKYHYKQKIRFRCKTNYTIIGRYTMLCRSDGMWSGFKPTCLAPCKDPGIPEGGVRLDHSFKHSQTVRFMCRKRNQPPSLSYLTCSNGRWNQNIPRCIADCNDPGIPANGQRRGNDFTLKNKVFFTCDRGYMRVGPEYLQCQNNRRWSDKAPICEPLSCTRPTPPENAYIHSRRHLKEKYGFNEVVMFQCNKGYRASGSPFVRCLPNGWSKTDLRCPPKTCGDRGTPTNGERQGNVFTFNNKVNFTCTVGYKLKGSAQRVCQENGTWSGFRTTCERVECKNLGTPRNGVRRPHKNKYVFEDRIDFRCNTNHTLRGDAFIICQSDRTWAGTVPRCLAPCRDPGIPIGGQRYQHSFLHNSIVQFRCNSGWTREGSHTIRCTDGQWDHKSPTCNKGCSRPNKYPSNGGIHGSSRHYRHKAYIRYYCSGGYNRVGQEYVRCLNGTWQNRQPTCRPKTCGDPGTSTNGERQGNVFTFNNKVNFTCTVGYKLKGSAQRVCQENGTWSGFRTTCEPVECKNLGTPRNGVRRPHKNKYVFEDRIDFRCNTNHTLRGDAFIICQSDRTWAGTVPRCLAPCRDPGIPIGGQRYQHSFLHNSIVQFRCNSGWTREGSHTIRCTDGQWDHKSPTCNKDCSRPNKYPSNGGIHGSSSSYRHKAYIRYYCYRGYNRVGQEYVRCLNGTWQNRQPTCRPVECRDPGRLYNGGRYPEQNEYVFEDKIRFQCKTNYTLRGYSSITCRKDKSWSGNVPRCLAPCRDPGIPNHGSRHDHSFLHNARVRFSCRRGWNIEGSQTIRCDNGNWDHPTPECLEECSRPNKYPSNGGILGSSSRYRHKTYIRYFCYGGYNPVGQEYVRCLNGTWQNRQPTCRPVECRDPGRLYNGGRHPDKNEYVFKDKMRFQCKTNYTLRGDSSITCRQDKRWSGNVPRCLAPCRDPGIPNHGHRQDHSFLHNARVRFSCQRMWNIEGSQTIRCNNGNWDHPTPQCLDCGSALGMESGKIPDGNIRASSTRYRYHAKDGRLNGRYAWCSESEREPYLQIDFGKPYRITGLATQGSAYDNKWVEKYTVGSNLAGSAFNMYREDNRDKIFIGNNDEGTIVRNRLRDPVIARRLRIFPKNKGRFYYACMRVEIYGCDLPSDCIVTGSRIVAKWSSIPRGGYKYYKAYLTSISRRYWRVEPENENYGRPGDKNFVMYEDLPFVLDVPPKHEELQVGSRVLAPWGHIYYTGTIKTGRDRYNRYRVRADDGDEKLVTIDQIRLLKAPTFCN